MIILISKAFILMGILASFCGILGFILYYTGTETNLVDRYYDFPYSGDKLRALGFTSSPGMLMELIGMAITFLLGNIFANRKAKISDIIIFILLGTGAFLSFSKEIVLLIVILLFLILLHFKASKTIRIILSFIVFLCISGYIFFTHVIVIDAKQKDKLGILSQSEYSSGKILYENKSVVLLESSYLALKRISLSIGTENLLNGIGSGNYANRLAEMKQSEQYPPNLFIYDPHSTYFGTLAENGVIALAVLLLTLCVWYNQLLKNIKTFIYHGASAILAWLLVCWLNAISCDILNYRHLWVLLGIASGVFASSKAHAKSQPK